MKHCNDDDHEGKSGSYSRYFSKERNGAKEKENVAHMSSYIVILTRYFFSDTTILRNSVRESNIIVNSI